MCLYLGAYSVIVIIIGNWHGDTSSNPRWDSLHFSQCYYPWKQYVSDYSPSS